MGESSQDFELGAQLQGHEKACRCACVLTDGRIATGALDEHVLVWKKSEDGSWLEDKRMHYHTDYVYCLAASSNGGFYSGAKDKTIYRMDAEGSPMLQFEGHEGPVCSVQEAGMELISGSWDGTARVWDLESGLVKYTLAAGNHAVCVATLPTGEVVTGSQAKAIKIWRGEECINTVEEAHADIIRSFAVHTSCFATCSNDTTVKLWTLDGIPVGTFNGHSTFVFDVSFSEDGKYVFSCGDDKGLKIWKKEDYGLTCEQTVLHSSSVWGCVPLPNGDVLSCCQDGVARIWTRDPARMAPEAERQAHEQMAQMAIAEESSRSGGAIPMDNVTDISEMPRTVGKKNGEIKMFKDKGSVWAYTWNGRYWDCVGEVTGSAKQKVAFEGDDYFKAGEYDYVFDVDLSGDAAVGGGRMAKLPFNDGGNVMVTAQNFVAREKLHISYLNQIMDFIRANAVGDKPAPVLGSEAAAPPPKPSAPSQPAAPPAAASKHFPVLEVLLDRAGKPDVVVNKLIELNGQFPDDFAGKMNPTETTYLPILAGKLMMKDRDEIRMCEREVLWLKLKENWPQDKMFPVYDLLRFYLLHRNSSELFKGNGRTAHIAAAIDAMGKDINGPLGLCAARFLVNVFAQPTPKYAAYDRRQLVIPAFESLHVSTNAKVRQAGATGLLNMSVTVAEKPAEVEGKAQLIGAIATMLKVETEAEAQYRLLGALGTAVVKDTSGAVKTACGASGINELLAKFSGAEDRLKQASADILKLL
mmetsp:Transcript_8148/g.19441  ORF Transcript_8148/g.19441 Transcript_8148/m.19441 type:complete len:753 (-) Transcript_8148:238-2496(-)